MPALSRAPPSSGPREMDRPEAAAHEAMAWARFSGGKTRRITAKVVGMIIAAAIPMSARTMMIAAGESRNPATAVVTAKAAVPQTSRRRSPNRSPALPPTSRKPAKVRV